MKRVSNTIKPVLLSSLRHSIFLPKLFSKYLFVLILTGISLTNSSFRSENPSGRTFGHQKLNVPFKGEYTFSFGANGVSGSGIGSHIGRFMLAEQNNNEGFPVITGTATITAANGDQLFATHYGVVQMLGNGMAQVDAEFTITGGTGRFSGATGSFESHGPANLVLGTGSAVFEGSLDY